MTGLIAVSGCTGTQPVANAPVTPPAAPATYTLSVNSTNPASGVPVGANPIDLNNSSGGNTGLVLTYKAGTSVVLSPSASAGLEVFGGWTGCASTTGVNCTVVVTANTVVTAAYKSGITVSVSPSASTVIIGSGQQFTAVSQGTTGIGVPASAVTWAVALAAGSTGSAGPGTITAAGLYQTPFPAPPAVVVTATSTADPAASASAAVSLVAPATVTGMALTVDTSAVVRPISPLIYGMNSYGLSTALQAKLHIPVDRWGGDATTRYNYQLDITNSASDYFYENDVNANTSYPASSDFNTQVVNDKTYGSATLASVPLIGWTTKRTRACSFSVAKYGAQKQTDPYNPDCGLGTKTDGTLITGNDPTDTSTPIDQTFVSGWVQYLVNRFGASNAGGVAMYQLDNEPEYYSAVHRDVHPTPMSYDEVTGKGLTYAKAIKAADPAALISGPTISNWDTYFYSWQDLVTGWSTGPCYCYNGSPKDRLAHGDVPLLAYYLQQFKAAEASGGTRLLDYVDIHTYFASPGAAFAPAGDTTLQAARLNSTRVFWDSTYTDPAYTDPSVRTAKAAPYPPQLIRMLTTLVTANYPGTKTAITEYAWGGQESINGAVAQADILGIFGKYGLDMGMLWGPPNPATQVPAVLAFQMFQNYDGNGSAFGDGSLAATTTDQSKLAIYAAKRKLDGAETVLILNKTFGAITSTLTLQTLAPSARVYQLSAANLNAIVPQTDATITTQGGNGSITATYPAQSITLVVVPY